ncbi:MBL fold metallo-hydrolase [Arcobacter sp. CECT 8983]|uniref:MBL fold metallo-hydrolase n=1 Tax=Arcobacter sp. CECT 8983 TaxID=2044508 RepID=UPI00100ABD29|nr:MBL fold metallo-hydrolase [Arcobacter sp. CECT 8983]RXJ90702.1 MBL fold metallo-hydrolase [Arcobacter sp. CECT 8983]
MKLTKLFFALSFFITLLFANNHDKKEVVITTTKVANNIYMLQGQGGNIGVQIGKDGILMIDSQFAPLTKKIKGAISKLSQKNIKYLVNTHWHYDHTNGNENIGKDGVTIVAHENVKKRLSEDTFIKAFNKTVPALSKVGLPTITFNDKINFSMNNENIEVIYQKNAHTDGDSVIFFENANVVHTGDIYFNGFYPFIDESSKGDVDGIIKAVDYILSRIDDKTKVIPGHGKLSNKKELIYYKDTLVELNKRMKKLISEGKTLEEIVALKPFADYDKKLGGGFLPPEKFLKIFYGVVKANQ